MDLGRLFISEYWECDRDTVSCQRATRRIEKVVMSTIELSTELNVQLRAEFFERLKKDE